MKFTSRREQTGTEVYFEGITYFQSNPASFRIIIKLADNPTDLSGGDLLYIPTKRTIETIRLHEYYQRIMRWQL